MINPLSSSATKAFTLVEMLVVIVIIGILSATMASKISDMKDRARIVSLYNLSHQVEGASKLYMMDYGKHPPDCNLDCNNSPLEKYFPGISKLAHPRGGHLGFLSRNLWGDGKFEFFVLMDDDVRNTYWWTNGGAMPLPMMLQYDKVYDNGDGLLTGNVVGNFMYTPNGVGIDWGEIIYALYSS